MRNKLTALFAALLIGSGAFSTPAAFADSPPLVPYLSPPESAIGGFVVYTANYNPAFSWNATVFPTGYVSISSFGVITVTGLTSGTSAVLTVTTSRSGYLNGTTTVAGVALREKTSLQPYAHLISQSQNGFALQIDNYLKTYFYMNVTMPYIWNATSSKGSATVDSNGRVNVTGLKRGDQATVVISVEQAGYLPSTASITASALAPPTNISPILAKPISNSSGFSMQITNFDEYFDWSATATNGQAVVDSSGYVQVKQVDLSKLSKITVTASRSGTIYGQQIGLGYSTPSALVLKPILGTEENYSDGFTIPITNFDSMYTWSVSSQGGYATLSSTGEISVSGMNAGENATVSISQSILGSNTTTWTYKGSSFPSKGLEPEFGDLKATDDGFVVKVKNVNTYFEYDVQVSNGNAMMDSSGIITVTGLPQGESSQLTVSTSKKGHPGGSADITGTANLSITVAPAPVVKKTPKSTSSPTTKKKAPAKTVTITPSGSSSIGKTTIICVKGSTKKFVTANKPVCPAGFKKK